VTTTHDEDRCPHCKGSGIEPRPDGVTYQIGAPSCAACWGTGKKDSDTTAKLLMASGRLYGEIHAATGNTEQAITRTAEQSHIVALAERDALTAQVEALTAQRDEMLALLRIFGGEQCWVPEGHSTCFNHNRPAKSCPNRLARELVAGVDQ